MKTNSCGYDDISTKIKKIGTSYILSPLAYICNKVLQQGYFLTNLLRNYLIKAIKQVFLTTEPLLYLPPFLKLLKRLYAKDYSNVNMNKILVKEQFGFRTNSLYLPPFLKLLKRLYAKDYSNVNMNKILVKEQFGFRTNSSTKIAIYILIIYFSHQIINYWLVVYDLQIAFDCLSCEMLSKMRFYGISGLANKLIKSYLQDRYQRVLINSEDSNIFLNGSK